MVRRMPPKNYIYRILARLSFLQASLPPYAGNASAANLYEWLLKIVEREGPSDRFVPKSAEELKRALRNLEAIGVVQGSIDPQIEKDDGKDECQWRFAGSLSPNLEILWRDGSNDGKPPPKEPGDGGDGDGGGPGGLAQVLEHPILFALDEKDLDEALAGAFGTE
jgi:hypothetical protein